LELFQANQYQTDSLGKRRYRRSFFGFIRVYEKAISIVIVFFIVSLISFSLGVEKGKRLTDVSKKEEILIDRAQLDKVQTQPKESVKSIPLPAEVSEEKKDISKYTIQVASFKTKTYAQKEADRLKNKGLDALTMPKGKHIIVCIGNFSKKQEAEATLSQLKQMYHDCYIREL